MSTKHFVVKYGLDNNNETIINVATPVNDTDAATKGFSSNAGNLTSGTVAAARMPAFSGDATSTAGSTALTLANSGVTAGSYGSSTAVSTITVDDKGRITSASSTNIRTASTSQTGVVQLSSATNSTSTTLAATAGAVKSAYDLANAAIPATQKGAANGVATLDASGLVPTSQLPSYVDDVLEYTNLAAFPATGETAKIYVARDTNKIYRWSGSAYIEISPTAGNADTATKLATARTIALSGDVTGSTTFDGSADVTITATIAANSIALGTDTTGNYVASIANGSYITGGGAGSEGAALTLAVDATSANTASKVVARDASGNFSAGAVTVNSLIVDGTLREYATVTTAATTQVTLTTFAAASYGSGEFLIQATQGTARHITKILVTHNGTIADATEYGSIITGSSLFSADVDINTGNVRILITPTSATSTAFKTSYQLISA